MMKKHNKLLAIAFTTCCASVLPVSAKIVTVDTLEDEASKIIEKLYGADAEINDFYIIGQYAYTNQVTIGFSDISGGIRTIPDTVKDEDITIYLLQKNNDGKWEVTEKYGDGSNLPDLANSFNIMKVDRQGLYSYKVNTDEAVNQLVETIKAAAKDDETNESGLAGALQITSDGNKINIQITDRDRLIGAAASKTGLATDISEILASSDGYAGIKFTQILPEGSKDEPKVLTIKKGKTTTTESIKNSVMEYFKSMGITSKLDDFVGTSFKLEFLLTDPKDTANGENASNDYTFTFTGLVDTNKYFETTYNSTSYKVSCKGNEGEKCTPVFNIINSDTGFANIDRFSEIVHRALEDKLIASVDVNIGGSTKNYTSNTSLLEIKSSINGLVTSANIKKYGDFAEKTLTITFNLAKDKGAISKYKEVSEIYDFKVGAYIDYDGVMEALVANSNENPNYSLTMNGNTLTLDVKLNDNAVNLRSIVDALDTVFKTKDTSMTIKLGKLDKEVTYTTSSDSSGNQTIRGAFWKLLGVSEYVKVTPGIMANADDLVITLSSKNNETAYPGTLGKLSEDDKSVEYTIKFTVSGFDVDKAAEQYVLAINTKASSYFKDLEYKANKADDGSITSRNLTVQLHSLTTPFSAFAGKGTTGLLQNLTSLAGAVTMKINGAEIPLDNTSEMLTTIPEALGIKLTDTISALADKPAQIEITLNNNISEVATAGEGPYTINVTFKTEDVIKTFNNESGKLSDLISSGVEQIILEDDVTVSDALALSKDFEIDGAGHTITISNGVTLSGDSTTLKLSNVTLDTQLKVSGKKTTIIGDGNTTIKGGINASAGTVEDLTIDHVKIDGTTTGLVTNDKKSVIDATGAEKFVMTGSSVRYTGDNSDGTGTQIYSLVKVDGNTTITDSKFDITKIKNPIEFKYYSTISTRISEINISGNEFTGDNYVATDSHNVISIYSLDENAVVNIMKNTFQYANSAIRISNNGDKHVTFNVVENTVESYNEKDTLGKALIVIRPNTGSADLSKITINHNGNKFGTADYTYNKDKIGDDPEDSFDTRLVYVYDKDSKGTTNDLKVSNYTAQP